MSEENKENTPEVNPNAPADAVEQLNKKRLAKYAEEVNKLQSEIVANDALVANHSKIALEFSIKAGCLLLKAKDIVGQGGWMDWVTVNIKGASHRTVNRYMALAAKVKDSTYMSNFDNLKGLREAYIRAGIIADKKEKTGGKKEPSPERVKEKDKAAYDKKLNEARQTIKTELQSKLEDNSIDWKLSTWSIKNNRPCSDGPNYLACLLNTLKEWIAARGFSKSLTVEDEVSTKAGIVLNEVVKMILQANNPAAHISPVTTGFKNLEGLEQTTFTINKQRANEVAEAKPAGQPQV
ncbi:MAG: hypothetical protein ACLQVX_19560 [Limisphaerales bacterium]